jgi:hypothetical protein
LSLTLINAWLTERAGLHCRRDLVSVGWSSLYSPRWLACTLTLDLFLDQGGLVLIDAAANHGTYADAPSAGERGEIALAVVDALGVGRWVAASTRP